MTKGETLRIEVNDANATAVEFRFGGASVKTMTGTNENGTWKASGSTASWDAGHYEWQAWATFADGSLAIIDRGNLRLDDALGVGDLRSVARKNLDAIEAMLTKKASSDVRRYKINNRELEKYSTAELLEARSYWMAEVKREERAEAGRSILGPRIAIRF